MNTILEDEITEEEFFGFFRKPAVIIVILIMALFSKSLLPIFIYVFIYAFIKIAFVILNSKRLILENEQHRLKSKRTECIKATVQRINVVADVEYDEIQIVCRATINGIDRTLKSKKVKKMPRCKVGEQVNVMVQPDNYNNYEVLIEEIV